MSWLLDLKRFARPHPNQIGPGRLVLVVGPSGAGKDTLISGARAGCAGDGSVVFPLRVITRPSTAAEAHETLSDEAFGRAAAAGAFALSWTAHGHRYGIPASIDEDIRAGRTAVCNVSRTIIGFARQRYAFVTVVLVTAPWETLQARLSGRSRASDGSLADRLSRSASLDSGALADVEIRNSGRAETAVRRLLNVVRDPGIFIAC